MTNGKTEERAGMLAELMRTTFAPVRVEAGEVLARQGEKGEKFRFLASGAVDIVVTSEEGLRMPVARLGPGSHFGEMSLLCGMPVSADAVASEASVLYECSEDEFDEMVRQRPELVEYMAGELSVRLKRANEQMAAQQQRQATLSRLISSPSDTSFRSDLPGLGKSLMSTVEDASNSGSPVVIVGESGVGRRALGLHIHSTGPRRSRAAIVVDCRELPRDRAGALLFGDAPPEAVSCFAERLGYLQAAHRGTLILGNATRLPAEVQDDLALFLRADHVSFDEDRVDVRIVVTLDAPPGSAVSQGGLTESLAQALGGATVIQLRPVRQRRRDIIPLSEHFLRQAAQLNGRPQKRLDEDARRRLLSYDYRIDNAEELRQVVNLGADLAESEIISAEHLFFGAGVGTESPHIDLLRWAWLERTLGRGRAMTIAKAFVGLAFAAIVAACILLPGSLGGKLANAMVWGVWWPVLIGVSILLGRAWCAVCPISSTSEAVQRAGGLRLSPTSRLQRFGPAVALVGFAGIIWIEHATGMPGHPQYTAALLLGLAAVAAVAGLLYQRHTWCRYLCPLGAMCAAFSAGSAIRVRARREACQGLCTGNECYKGSDQAKGCPMFNHVTSLGSGQHCKLCLECLRACPSQSARLVVQLPVRDIWRSHLVAADVAPVTVTVGIVALLLAAQSLLSGLWFTLGSIAAVVCGLAVLSFFRRRDSSETSGSGSWAARVIYAYAFSVAALLFAGYLRHLPWLDDIGLYVARTGANVVGISLLRAVQAAALGLGGALTLLTLWRLCRRESETSFAKSLLVLGPLVLLAVVYLAGGTALLGVSQG